MVEPAIFGPLDALLAPVIQYVVFVLVLANLGTRFVAHRSYVRQAADGADSIDRHLVHESTNVLLVLASFYYLTLHHHAGMVLSVLVLGMVITDFFEFESRQVENRRDLAVEPPKGALVASVLVLLYAVYIGFVPTGPIGQFL